MRCYKLGDDHAWRLNTNPKPKSRSSQGVRLTFATILSHIMPKKSLYFLAWGDYIP